MLKEIKDDVNKWKDIPCSCIGRLNIVKNDSAIQNAPESQCNTYTNINVFAEIKKILKFIRNIKRPQVAKINLKKNEVGGSYLQFSKLIEKLQ